MLSRCCWWRSPLARLRSSVTACIGRFAIGGRDEVVDVASPNLPLVTFHVDQLRGKELDFFAQCYDYLSYCHEQEPSQVAQRLMIQLAQQCLRGQPYSQPRTAASTLLFDVVFLPGAIPCFGWFHNEGRLLSSSFADHIGDLWRHQPASLWLLQQNGSSEAGRHHAIYRLLGMRHSSTCEDELRKFHQHNMRWLIGGLMGLKERSAEITMMMYSVNTLCPYYCSRLPSLPPEEWKACVIPEHSLGLRSERILLRHALLSSVGNDVANSNHGSNASLLKVLRTSASTSHECQSICRILLRAGLSVSDAEPPAIVACSPSSSELQRLVHAFWMLDEVQHAQKHMTLIALEVRKLLQQLHAEEEILLAPSLNRDGPLPPRPSVQQQWNEGLVDMKTFASMIQVYGRGFAASHAETADGIITDSATAMVLTGEPVIPTLGLDGDCAWTDALHACDVLCSMLFLDGKAQRRHTSFMADVVALRRALRIRFLLRCGFTTRHHWGSLSNAMRAFPFAEAVELSMRNSATLFCVVFHRGNASNMQPLRLADVFDGQGGVCMALSTLLPRLAPVVLDGGCADNFCSTPGTRTLSADLCFLPEGAQTLTLHLPSEIAEAIQAILGEEKTNDRTVVGLVKHQHRWARAFAMKKGILLHRLM